MNDADYWNRRYTMGARESSDELRVEKRAGTDWCDLSMQINGEYNGRITIRSREMAEELHFMLGRMLSAEH